MKRKKSSVCKCQDILEQLETEPNLLKRVVTSDNLSILKNNPLAKRENLEWNNAVLSRSKKKKRCSSPKPR